MARIPQLRTSVLSGRAASSSRDACSRAMSVWRAQAVISVLSVFFETRRSKAHLMWKPNADDAQIVAGERRAQHCARGGVGADC
eukprot:5769424-Pleurochrysis_carterae.AAC.2